MFHPWQLNLIRTIRTGIDNGPFVISTSNVGGEITPFPLGLWNIRSTPYSTLLYEYLVEHFIPNICQGYPPLLPAMVPETSQMKNIPPGGRFTMFGFSVLDGDPRQPRQRLRQHWPWTRRRIYNLA